MAEWWAVNALGVPLCHAQPAARLACQIKMPESEFVPLEVILTRAV
jgi:hypothetical protein